MKNIPPENESLRSACRRMKKKHLRRVWKVKVNGKTLSEKKRFLKIPKICSAAEIQNS